MPTTILSPRLQSLLSRLLQATRAVLADDLVGFYVHGSIALGCFTWEGSDVDFLVVTRNVPADGKKSALLRSYLEIDRDAPKKGLEMSLVTESACRDFYHPMPYELHFSHGHLERALADPDTYAASMHGVDRDLAAHVTITRACGIALFGPEPKAIFAPVPAADYTDALLYDIGSAEDEIADAPVYLTLNLCRVAAWLEEGAVLSKARGGEWGLAHADAADRPLIQAALDAYTRGATFPEDFPRERLRAFAARMLERIRQHKP